MILLAIIGITTAILGELKQRRKEFGIRMACGASIKDISKEIIIKVLILSFISAILGFLYVGYTVGEYTLGLGIKYFSSGIFYYSNFCSACYISKKI